MFKIIVVMATALLPYIGKAEAVSCDNLQVHLSNAQKDIVKNFKNKVISQKSLVKGLVATDASNSQTMIDLGLCLIEEESL